VNRENYAKSRHSAKALRKISSNETARFSEISSTKKQNNFAFRKIVLFFVIFKINGKMVKKKRQRTNARLRAYFVPDKGVFTCSIKRM
jgi:hypothetical protein